ISRLQKLDYHIAVKDIFSNPTVAQIAERISEDVSVYQVPANGITIDTDRIVPEMVPLLDFDQEDIDKIIASVSGGVANIQDIYPLSPLQEGMYFHYLMSNQEKGDPYVLPRLLSFTEEEKRTNFIEALQFVVDRHDVLRTCFVSEGLPSAVQVVLREAKLSLEYLAIDESKDMLTELELLKAPGNLWMDVSKAPLLQLKLANDPKNGTYYLLLNQHHLVLDHIGMEKVISEMEQYLLGNGANLPTPVLYRDYIAHTVHQQSINDSAVYFKELLGAIEEPTYPFDLSNVQGNGSAVKESRVILSDEFSKEIRKISTELSISPAVIFHAAYGILIAKCSNAGSDYAIFGSLFSGRLQGASGASDSLGLFINTLPFLTTLEGSITEYIHEVSNTLRELLPYEQTPLSSIQNWSSIANDVPLFSALLNFRHSSVATEVEEKEESIDLGITVISDYERTNYPLILNVDDYGELFGLNVQIDREHPNKVLDYMQEILTQLVEGLKSEDKDVASITIVPKEEEIQLLEAFNNTTVNYPLEKTLVDLFAEQVAKTPDAVAVVFEDKQLTFKELDLRSNQLGHYLRDQGIQPDILVGICIERSLEMLLSILGILKAGGAYVPIDPEYPEDRIDYMLNDANINLVLSSAKVSEAILEGKEGISCISLDSDWNTIETYSSEALSTVLTPENLAYVIYTSGSTGKPKGVMNQHNGIVNRLLWTQSEYQLTAEDTILQKTTFSFDVSVWELLWGTICGSKLVFAKPEGHKDARYLKEIIEQHSITTMHFVPSMLRVFLEEISAGDCSSLQRIICSGEALQVDHVQSFNEKFTEVELHNLYGPTEAAIDVSYWQVPLDRAIKNVLIGSPVANTSLYVVDDAMNLAPIGVAGELCIGGVQVARGYYNKPILTSERFVENPFAKGDRLYKTGDLARWLPDGNIEYIGRKDNQVKIRGYRIELGEIENALSLLSSVSQCCVLAKEDAIGSKRLVGYVVASEVFDKEAIQSELKESLPEYMVPTLWVELDEMPLTVNGKLNRKALPEPDGAMLSRQDYVAPRTKIEQELASIWQDILKIEKIGIYDNFFELGGHSLLVVQLISRLQKLNYHVEVQDIFSNSTIEAIGEKISSEYTAYQVPENGITIGTDRIVPEMVPLLDFEQEDIDTVISYIDGGIANIQDMYPLSPLQKGIYFHHLMSDKEEGDPYVIPYLLSFKTAEERSTFIEALQFVVNRHDVLRTAVVSEGLPTPVQIVSREALLKVETLDLDSSKDVLSELEELTAPGNQWMDVTKAPLLHLQVADDPQNTTYYLVLLEHHLIIDHIGLEKIISEIVTYISGEGASLPEPVLYRDFIGHTLHQQATNDSAAYFTNLLGTVDTPSYPFDLSNIQVKGSSIKETVAILPQELSNKIRTVTTKLGMSPAILFHAAYGIVVGKCSNMEYAIFGSLFSGRLQGASGAGDSLGLFINTLPFYIALEGNILAYVEEVKQRLQELLPYEQTPLSNIQDWSGVSNEVPLFSALLNFRHSFISSDEEAEESSIDLGIINIDGQERTNYPFTLSIDDYGNDFGLTAQIEESIEADRVIVYMQEVLEQLVESLDSEDDKEVAAISILGKEEETKLLEVFNATDADYALDKTILDLFAAQVQQSQKATAIVYKGTALSYKELDQRSNQVARYLRDQGVESDGFVGICIERSLEMLVGILGVLKSGGAYVPIDPNYPQDRVDYMIEDTATGLVLSSAQSRTILEHKKDITIVSLDSDWDTIASYSASGLETKITQADLAYVIYTSGSTGKPKGVLIEHGNMFNLVNWALDNFEESLELGMLASTSINFDLSIFELFTSLASGSKIELVDNLLSLVEDSDISVSLINTVPSVLLGVLDSGKLSETVKTINLAGEPLLPSLVDRIYAESSVESVYDLYGPSEATTYSTFIKRD
ncbi:non-ribosomal peptide synthetase, partial [Tenacibaculum agarivorans]|uniref:non-ribosomal peptide synthetase n=1 Tax=Tenacibaculum agarivorans TaxID=1908389 RepID=UPI000B2817A9